MSPTAIERLAAAHGIRLLLQFGSTITGRVHPGSDIDLACLLDRPPTSFSEWGRLSNDLQSLFPDRPVDLVILNRADPLLLRKITESARLLHGESSEFLEFKIRAFKRYQDHRKYLEMERRWVEKQLAPGAFHG